MCFTNQYTFAQQDQKMVAYKEDKEVGSIKLKPLFACIVPDKLMCCIVLKDGIKLVDVSTRTREI